jgi:Predicted hydrolases or acyltransferases (alpha/beta hydrolase superfamily)
MLAPVEEIVDVGGAGLWTVTQGTGRPVVWCHGGPGGIDNLGPVAAMIADVARVYRFEQRACGRSSGGPPFTGPPFTMGQAVADLDTLRRHWGHPWWVVAGHSFGAALALAYALEHPDRTEAVIYVSCVVRLEGQPDWYEAYRQARLDRLPGARRARFLELNRLREQGPLPSPLATERRSLTVHTEFADPATAERMRAPLLAEFAAVNDQVNRELGADFSRYFARESIRSGLRAIEVPVLLIHGTADPRPIAAVEALAAVLPHPRLIRLEGVGHFPFWESPDVLRAILRDFLASGLLTSGVAGGSLVSWVSASRGQGF